MLASHPEQDLEREFYVAAALMVSVIAGFPEGQAEALRLRLPQLLWKVQEVFLFCFYCETLLDARGVG